MRWEILRLNDEVKEQVNMKEVRVHLTGMVSIDAYIDVPEGMSNEEIDAFVEYNMDSLNFDESSEYFDELNIDKIYYNYDSDDE